MPRPMPPQAPAQGARRLPFPTPPMFLQKVITMRPASARAHRPQSARAGAAAAARPGQASGSARRMAAMGHLACRLLLMLAVATAPLALPAMATPATGGGRVPWSQLSPAQRDVLSPLREKWNQLPPHRQQHLLHRAERWSRLPPARRAQIRERIRQWQRMTPQQRAEARRNMRRYRQLTPRQREELHQAYRRFKALPPAERERLRKRWHQLSPAQRARWLNDQLGLPSGHTGGSGH